MNGPAETTPVTAAPSPGPPGTPVLFGLAAVTGVVDAVCYLGFGHVFTANMTGNVMLLGFVMSVLTGAAAGALLLRYSAVLTLGVAGAASTVCAVAAHLGYAIPSRITEGTRP